MWNCILEIADVKQNEFKYINVRVLCIDPNIYFEKKQWTFLLTNVTIFMCDKRT